MYGRVDLYTKIHGLKERFKVSPHLIYESMNRL